MTTKSNLWPIFVPSKGRAGKSPLLAQYTEQVFAVVEPQDYEAYRAAYPKLAIMSLGADNRGIVFVRQWILEFFLKNEQASAWYWMLDDDITAFTRAVDGKNVKIPMTEALTEAQNLFLACPILGQGALEYQQFSWSATKETKHGGYCDVCVAINAKLVGGICRYDPRVAGKEDRDFTMQVMANGFGTARASKLGFAAPKNGSNAGGLSDWYADRSRERACTEAMIAKWGPEVCSLKVKKDGRPDCAINWKALRS